jgi:GNAT superfamily N-acetyltransferase
VRVEEVDPRDDAAYATWFGVVDASLTDQRPGEPHWLSGELREVALRRLRPGAGEAGPLLTCVDDGAVAGAARLTLPLHDNRHLAAGLLEVHPEHRRRGVGTALLAELVSRAAAAGRTTLTVEVDDLPGGCPAPAFLQRHGFVPGLREVRRDLPLPVPDVVLGQLAAAAALDARLDDGTDYRLRTWVDRTPPELLDQRAALARAMSVETPWGEVPHEEEVWDAARVTAGESALLAQDRTWVTAVAVRDGELVAVSDAGVPRADPRRAYQWSTLVLPAHRGHRLGLLVKLAAVRALPQASPATRTLTTWNAEDNLPVVRLNEAMGFVRNGGLTVWTRALGSG